LGLLLLICALALYLWQLVLARSMTASETGAAKRSKQRQQTPAPALAAQTTLSVAVAGGSAARLSTAQVQGAPGATASRAETSPRTASLVEQLQALVKKELLCFWRDPQLKIRMFQSLFYVLIFVLVPTFSGGSGKNRGDSFYSNYTPFAVAAVIFLFMLTLSLNTLGIERQSLTALFLFPIDRKRLLWGKNLAVALLGCGALVVLMVFCAVATHEQAMILPAVVIGLAGMAITLGSGNLSSTYFPRYQRAIGQRGYSATGGPAQSGGCLNQIMSLVMLVTTAVLLTPVALGIGIPFFMNAQWVWLATIPLSLLYGAVLYLLFTNLAAKRMLATEPEILAITTRE
ncbi:MAG: putative ABC transporter permease subunit, partial [Ktedonobacteraceae bacterium]